LLLSNFHEYTIFDASEMYSNRSAASRCWNYWAGDLHHSMTASPHLLDLEIALVKFGD
jgi:hypothetical protein